jgi:HD-GYP domain-containing protein (c-di-GMP phosphodiesterase class II)
VEKVFSYMIEQSGKHFDPQVISVFLKLMEEKGGSIGYEH